MTILTKPCKADRLSSWPKYLAGGPGAAYAPGLCHQSPTKIKQHRRWLQSNYTAPARMIRKTNHMTKPQHHSLIEDIQGIAFGSVMAAFGIAVLTHLGLVTGQTAGLAILISYATGWAFGPVFFIINIPFYWVGYKRLGGVFTLKTFISVGLLSTLSYFMPQWVAFDFINPIFGALLFGCISGVALIVLFRHGASLGGIGIIALILQEKTGFRAGYTQLIFDSVLFAAALSLRDVPTVAISALGALVINLTIAINHRRDRYIAT
jgi:uncharacterized membrane-anchored protein YitT (DUF2179 family)